MSTCTSDRRGLATGAGGFSLIELLLGLSLALCLALGLAPVWVSFQALGAREGDETIWALQGRVATARFERDVRLAGFETCPFPCSGSVLQATASQVVLLVSTPDSTTPILVEWELVNGSLMRRWGECPAVLPPTVAHSLFPDSKTMMEAVDTGLSGFSYRIAGREMAAVPGADLSLVDTVAVHMVEAKQGAGGAASVAAGAGVGR